MIFYNVENLFPPDEEFSEIPSSGLRNWDNYKYNQKIRKITSVLHFITEDHGQLPSIIGLAEIGDQSVLDDLINGNSLVNNYEIIYQKSKDSRGLSVALLFDKSKYSLIQFRFLQFQFDDDQEFDTRDILHAEFLFKEKKIHIFVCHLPSKRNQDANKAKRNHIIEKLKQTLQQSFDQEEPMIIMGDFNENPNAEELQQLLLDKNDNKMLSNLFETLYLNNQFSTYHGKKGVGFDQILYTEKLLTEAFGLQTITAEIYNSPRLRNKTNKSSQYPLRTYSGSRYIGGYSDHFPVILKLNSSI